MNVNVNYPRVIPRDLFNESKLLKCIGKLCLLIHDNNTPIPMSFDENIESFEIGLLDDGFLIIVNLNIFINDYPYLFKTQYNSKNNYSLFVEHEYCDYLVFNENGDFDSEFKEFCSIIS